MSTLFSVGLMNQLGDAFEKAGFTSRDVTALRTSDLEAIRSVLRGDAEIRQLRHLIEGDADPFVPEGWRVQDHIPNGPLHWDPAKVRLHASPRQQTGTITIAELRQELPPGSVLNVNALDYLLAHPQLIPQDWKGKAIFFFGTVYQRGDHSRVVRCLCWNGHRWDWGYYTLDRQLDFSNYAAIIS